jgi:transposase InsO family protein
VFTEAADRLRGQLVRADRILTGALEALEDAGSQFRSGFWRPIQKASALVQGIRVGIDILRSRRGNSKTDEPREPREPREHEEELFI